MEILYPYMFNYITA